jgi:hypothetical protein
MTVGDGELRAMAPANATHGIIQASLCVDTERAGGAGAPLGIRLPPISCAGELTARALMSRCNTGAMRRFPWTVSD